MMSKHLYGAVLMGAIVTTVGIQGCSSSDNPLCCTEFKPGATVDVNIGGSAQSKIAVQSVADFSGIASAAVDDLSAACQSIATDLDATSDDLTAIANNTDRQARLKAYCDLAVKQIGTFSAGLTLSIDAKPPACDINVQAKASCQASCDVTAPKCDFKANPPVCTGGTLEIDCKGDCTAQAGASLDCTGSCSGSCSGSCTVQGGSVECAGKCNGTCSASAQGNGSGIQADGTCKGSCSGTCEVTAPKATCSGSCQGKCDATCKGSATASVKCSGSCSGDFQPISCSGGTLSGGCTPPSASCEGSCDASVRANATCTPPSLNVSFTGTGDATAIAKLKATLEANLGVVLSFKSRLSLMASVAGSFTANISAVTDIKAACIPVVVEAVGTAGTDLAASVTATGSLLGAVGSS